MTVARDPAYRHCTSETLFGRRGLFRSSVYAKEEFMNRVYHLQSDAQQRPGPVPSWEESRRYWSAILEEDVRTGFARTRKTSPSKGFTSQFLSDNGVSSQGRSSAPVDNRPGSYEITVPPLGATSFDIHHPNGMRYQYDGNGHLRVSYEETHATPQ